MRTIKNTGGGDVGILHPRWRIIQSQKSARSSYGILNCTILPSGAAGLRQTSQTNTSTSDLALVAITTGGHSHWHTEQGCGGLGRLCSHITVHEAATVEQGQGVCVLHSTATACGGCCTGCYQSVTQVGARQSAICKGLANM